MEEKMKLQLCVRCYEVDTGIFKLETKGLRIRGITV